MQNNSIRKAATLAVALALFVVMLGAYTRLTDAGLGCPDWPGCYGQMVLPTAAKGLANAQAHFPQIPIESRKASTEMAHRYLAGILGLCIVFIGVSVLYKRKKNQALPWHLPVALLILVVFQAALGMWTVTLKLLPVVVMGHLLGGMLIVACLSRFRFQMSSLVGQNMPQWRPWLRLGVLIVFLQIALGGWVSSNYAGISCIGFPMCNGEWLPDLYFAKGFNLFSPVGANYQGGLLDNNVRITIQFIHRVGAFVTAFYLLSLSLLILYNNPSKSLKIAALLLLAILATQIILGILNVLYLLPLGIAVAHNGVAAVLLATIFSMLHFTRGTKSCLMI
jgi:cytochrome c oxidase assembly protein subunit 15